MYMYLNVRVIELPQFFGTASVPHCLATRKAKTRPVYVCMYTCNRIFMISVSAYPWNFCKFYGFLFGYDFPLVLVPIKMRENIEMVLWHL